MEDYKDVITDHSRSCLLNVNEDFLTPKRMPRYFYQYSALASFKGIIESNNIWATHWAYLNDAKELKKGLEIAHIVISEMNKMKKFKTNLELFSILEEFINHFAYRETIDPIDAYVLCFSEENDKLNLWRGYGNGYNSIVTGYNTAKLKINEKIAGHPFMGKIVYAEDRQKRMMTRYISKFYENMAKIYKRFPKQESEMRNLIAGHFAAGILFLSLFMKDKYWSEEKEWRIIYLFPSNDFIDFKVTDKGYIPFIKAPIFKEHALKCINGVRLPKSPDFALREKALRMLWKKACNENKIKRNLKVEQSSISIIY